MSEKRIQLLKIYLSLLPLDLLESDPEHSAFNGFATFSLDPDMVKDEGEEHAVNKAIENALRGIPRHQDGAFDIMERGPAVENIASLLDYWTTKYPASVILDNWVNKALRSAEKVFERYQLPLPDLSSVQIRDDPSPQNTSASKKDKSVVLAKKQDTSSSKSAVSKKQDSKIFDVTTNLNSKTASSTSTVGMEAEEGSGSESTEDSDNLDDEHLDPSNPDPTSSKHDPLGWLDDGLPSDLSSDAQPHFLLEEIFDIDRYLDIPADGPLSNLTRTADEDGARPEKPSRKSSAAALMPDDDAWTTWK